MSSHNDLQRIDDYYIHAQVRAVQTTAIYLSQIMDRKGLSVIVLITQCENVHLFQCKYSAYAIAMCEQAFQFSGYILRRHQKMLF